MNQIRRSHILKMILFVCVVICGTNSMAADQTKQSWPAPPSDTSWLPIPYAAVKHLFWNGEEYLRSTLGLRSKYCMYKSARFKKTYRHNEIGACVYHHLFDSTLSKETKNPIYIWAVNSTGQTLTLRLDWSPIQGNLWDTLVVFNQSFYESKFIVARDLLQKLTNYNLNQLPVGSDHSLLGDITITFQTDRETLEGTKLALPEAIRMAAPDIQQITATMKPNGRQDVLIRYDLGVKINSTRPLFLPDDYGNETIQIDSQENIRAQLKTNINILDTRRKFKIEGKIKLGSGHE